MIDTHQSRSTQERVSTHAAQTDSYGFFNLITGPQLLEVTESLLPAHRERLSPPAETLSIFVAQALAADRSCQQAVDAAAAVDEPSGL